MKRDGRIKRKNEKGIKLSFHRAQWGGAHVVGSANAPDLLTVSKGPRLYAGCVHPSMSFPACFGLPDFPAVIP